MSSRELYTPQMDKADGPVTVPLLLVLWEHSGIEERFSTADPVTYGGENYVDAGIEVSNLVIGESATVEVAASASRVNEVYTGAYRGKACKIYAIPAAGDDDDVFETYEGILALDGVIESSEFTGETVRASIVNKHWYGSLTPRHTVGQVANHIPPANTVLFSTKEDVELEKPR